MILPLTHKVVLEIDYLILKCFLLEFCFGSYCVIKSLHVFLDPFRSLNLVLLVTSGGTVFEVTVILAMRDGRVSSGKIKGLA